MSRCVGTSSGSSRGTVHDRVDVVVTTDDKVTMNVYKGRSMRVVTLDGDTRLLIDLAHQIISASQTIDERHMSREEWSKR